jgi:sec-independent protein translocase protein TatA
MAFGELLVVLVIVLLVFGPGHLPEMMGNLGQAMREFQKGLNEPPETDVPAKKPTPPDAKRSAKASDNNRKAQEHRASRPSALGSFRWPSVAVHRQNPDSGVGSSIVHVADALALAHPETRATQGSVRTPTPDVQAVELGPDDPQRAAVCGYAGCCIPIAGRQRYCSPRHRQAAYFDRKVRAVAERLTEPGVLADESRRS